MRRVWWLLYACFLRLQFSFLFKKMPKRTAGDAMLPNSDQMERLMADSYGSCFVNAQSASADPSASVGDSATAVESAHATESAPAIEPTPGNESTPATGEPGRFSFKAVHTFQFQLVTDRHREHEPTLLVSMGKPSTVAWSAGLLLQCYTRPCDGKTAGRVLAMVLRECK